MEIRIIVGVVYFLCWFYSTKEWVVTVAPFVKQDRPELNFIEKSMLQFLNLIYFIIIVIGGVGIFDYITNPHHYSF